MSAAPMLSDFIRSNQEAIIAEWTTHVRRLSPAKELSRPVLVDHLPEILARISQMADTADSSASAETEVVEAPKRHAIDRLARGFDLELVIREYSSLRQCVLSCWNRQVGSTMAVSEVWRLDAAIDQSIMESCVSFARARERMLRAVDGISEAAFGRANVESFLLEILQGTVENAESVDTAAVLLREGDALRMRATVGIAGDIDTALTVKIGEGIIGRVAAEPGPILLRHAAEDPLVKVPAIRDTGVRALYVTPLNHAGSVIGVAYMGSRTAFEFSEEDKLLFRTMASRVTSVIVQTQLVDDLEKTIADRDQLVSQLAGQRARLHFLSEASRQLAESIDYETTLAKIARLAVPGLADWFMVDLLQEDKLSSIVVEHSDPSKVELVKDYRRRFPPDLQAPRGSAQVLRAGQPELYEDIPDSLLVSSATSDEHLGVMRELGMRSAMVVPLCIRGGTVGVISFISAESGRHFDRGDLEVAQGLADRAAMAIENARLFRDAERAIRLREDVLAVVSHDLRNPITSIVMSAAILLKRDPDLRTRKQVDMILRATGRMERLIRDLLDMASIQAGRLALERKSERIASIIAEAVEIAEPLAKANGQTLSMDLSLGEAHCSVDRDRVLQLLANLFGNAKKFCPPGGAITVRARVSGNDVECSIEDTGPGISAKDLPFIFDPYWSAKQESKKGIGLGLYISKGIVDAHGGRIWVDNRPGMGVTFYFTLPMRENATVA